jgi:hypothetical protein
MWKTHPHEIPTWPHDNAALAVREQCVLTESLWDVNGDLPVVSSISQGLPFHPTLSERESSGGG